MEKKELKYSLLLLITAAIWGLSFVAQVVGMDSVGALTFNGVRFAIGGLSLIPVILIFDRKKYTKEERAKLIKYGIILGVVLFAAATLQQFGVLITRSSGRAGFITGLYIVIVPIMGIFLGRKAGKFTWIGAIFSVTGLYLLSVQDGFGNINLGDVLFFIGAFLWATHIMVIDRFAGLVNPIRVSQIQFFTCSAISMICAFIFEDVTVSSILDGYLPILYGGVLASGVAYTLQTVGQQHVAPAKAAIIFSLESLFAAIGGAILIHEVMTPRAYVGCAFIFAGIIVSQFKFGGKTPIVDHDKI
ncbi:MAG: DMT family transporter [Clostridiales Family XIII bacterium]|jgi:drug/metabolite transporter (DMT)-like permease|nr:DMT family transporter [Clostridiales Family XIII bacterium]